MDIINTLVNYVGVLNKSQMEIQTHIALGDCLVLPRLPSDTSVGVLGLGGGVEGVGEERGEVDRYVDVTSAVVSI